MLRPKREQYLAAIGRVLDSGQYILGSELSAFEEEFAAYQDSQFCAGVSSGHDALVLILRALNVGVGDEVIVSGHTFASSWLAICEIGATPVPVDAELVSRNINATLVSTKITAKTKAIIIVHMYGRPADLAAIKVIADDNGLHLIEDCAQAHGAQFDCAAVGQGTASAFSFYPGKNLGAIGDAGAVCTNDEALYREVCAIRNYGSLRKYEHLRVGGNCRLDELQAAFLRQRLRGLSDDNAWRADAAGIYLSQLTDLDVPLPDDEKYKSSWHLFVVLVENREYVKAKLAELGVEASVHYPIALSRQKCFSNLGLPQLPIAEQICASCLSLPLWPGITNDQVQYVAESVQRLILSPTDVF